MNRAPQAHRIIGAAGLAGALLAGGLYAWRVAQPTHGRIRGRILEIDAPHRAAVLEYIHPRTGKTYELSGEVAPDCDIRIDGRPAKLQDLRVGDTVEAEGLVYRTGRVVAQRVRARRARPSPDGQSARPPEETPSRRPPAGL